MKRICKVWATIAIILCAAGSISALSYNGLTKITPTDQFIFWGAMTSSDLTVSGFSLTPSAAIYMGVAPNVEVVFWDMLSGITVRGDVTGGTGTAMFGFNLRKDAISPRFDSVVSISKMFSLEINVVWDISFVNPQQNMLFSAILAPTFEFSPISFFVEIDPYLSINTNQGFNIKLVPGMTLSLGTSGLTFAVTLDKLTKLKIEPSVSISYWMTFGAGASSGGSTETSTPVATTPEE